jgi:hypothetical protein
MNLDLIKKRYKELVPGNTISFDDINVREDLPICHKIMMEGRRVTAQSILEEKMKLSIRQLKNDDPMKLLMEAVLKIYLDSHPKI